MLIILNLVYLTTYNPAFYTIFRPFFEKLGINNGVYLIISIIH